MPRRPARYDPGDLAASRNSCPPLDSATRSKLVDAAREVARRAHTPASGFPVGAALLCDDGRIVVGCNVENASYGLSMCAERSAVFGMVADGGRRIQALAVWTRLAVPGSPCGACRQVLAEFADPGCPVILAGTGDELEYTTIGELLPRPFGFGDLHSVQP